MTYILQRISDSGNETFGTLLDENGVTLCVTIERPWLDNQPDISCIPSGTYHFYTYQSPTKGQVWRTDDVPNRKYIEIHAANWAHSLSGCIGVGKSITYIDGLPAVSNSDNTLEMLYNKLPSAFDLTIIGVKDE